MRTCLLGTLASTRERYSDSRLPIKELVRGCLNTCVSLVYTTELQRSVALIQSLLEGSPLAPELAAYCSDAPQAAVVLRHLLSQGGIGCYAAELVKACKDSLKALVTDGTKATIQPILSHLRAFQVSVAAHANAKNDPSVFTEWIRLLLQAASDVFLSAAKAVNDVPSGKHVLNELSRGITGQALHEGVVLMLHINTDPFSTDSIEIQHTLSSLRSRIKDFRDKLVSVGLGDCSAFTAEVAEKVKIVSETHASSHPYRLDTCETVKIVGASRFTITFDNGSKLDMRDELVVLYVDPVDRTCNLRTLKDNLSQVKLNLAASTAYVFAKGSARNTLGFGARSNELSRTSWGYAFTAKAVTSRPRFVLGWLHDVLLALTYASASIAKSMIKAGIDGRSTDCMIFRGGLNAYAEVSQGTKRQQAVPSSDSKHAKHVEVIPHHKWRALLKSHSLPSGDGDAELILRNIYSAALHLCSHNNDTVTWSSLNYLTHMRLKIQSLSIQGMATVVEKTEFLLHSMAQIPHDSSVTFDAVLYKTTEFVFSELSISNITSMLLSEREKARCRSRGLYSLRQLLAEASLWTRNVSLEGGCFMLQAITTTLLEALGDAPFSHGIACSGDVLMNAVRQDVYNVVHDLVNLAADINSVSVKALAQSVLALHWSTEDISFLANTIPAIPLLQEACLTSPVASSLFHQDKVSHIPGQSISPKMVKGEDVDSWHLSIEGTVATVRHDDRGVTSAFLWNSHEVRKGNCVVQLTKPWNFKHEVSHSIWYYEVKFIECSHRLVKGLSLGLCGVPLSQHYIYKNNGGVKTLSDNYTILPRFKLNDIVGCGVCMRGDAPHLFFTLNGSFFGFIEALPADVASLTPCVLVKYACKVQWILSPDSWLFNVRQVHESMDRSYSRHAIIQHEAGRQAWNILKKWAQISIEEPCVLTEQCLTVLKDRAMHCLTEGLETWLYKHIHVILTCVRGVAHDHERLLRAIEELTVTGWNHVLYGALVKTLGGWADGIQAAEASLEVLYLLLTNLGPQHPMSLCPAVCDLPELSIIPMEAQQVEILYTASTDFLLVAEVPKHPTIELLIRGASEGAPFVKLTNDTSSVAMLCVRLLRALGSLDTWSPYLEVPLLTYLHSSPRDLDSLRADVRDKGKKIIGTFTALTVLGSGPLQLTRGARCIYKPSYGTPQKCLVTDVSDEQHVSIVLSGTHEKVLEVNRDTVIPYDPSPPLVCAAAADAAIYLCYDLIKAMPDFKNAGLTGEALNIDTILQQTDKELPKECEALLPGACLLAALLHSSITAATSIVTNNWPDRSFNDVLALASKPLSIPATLPQLCQKKDLCIKNLDANNWDLTPKASAQSMPTSKVASTEAADLDPYTPLSMEGGNSSGIDLTVFGVNPLMAESAPAASVHDEDEDTHESHEPTDKVVYQQELSTEEEQGPRTKPIHEHSENTWPWCLLWLEAVCVSTARCLLVKLRSAHEGKTVDSYKELLLMLDTITLNATTEVEEWFPVKQLVGKVIECQTDSNILRLALDTFAYLSTDESSVQYATPKFDLSLQLLELLITSKPSLLVQSDDVIQSFASAIHMHSHRSKRTRIIRCLSRLLSFKQPAHAPIAMNWRCLGAIRHHCEGCLSLLSPSSELVMLNKQHSRVALAEAEMLYQVRALLMARDSSFDDLVVPHQTDTVCKWYIGKLVDKMDKPGKWYEAVVLAVRETTVYVTCKGLPSVHDEWVAKSSNRLKPHLEMTGATVQRQDFGKYNDVSDILTNASYKVEQRDTVLGVKRSKSTDKLTVNSSNDIRTIIASCRSNSSDVPRWYECQSSSGNSYTIIADHLLAVDMQSAAVCKIVSVDTEDEHRIPFALYCALDHLAECIDKRQRIPAVWCRSDEPREHSTKPLDLISARVRSLIEDAYKQRPPQSSKDDLPPLSTDAWVSIVESMNKGDKTCEHDSRYRNLIRNLNYGVLLPALPCLGLDASPEESFVVSAVNRLKLLFLKTVKDYVMENFLVTPKDAQQPIQVRLDRHSGKKPDAGVRDTLLGQLQLQLDEHPPSVMARHPPFRVGFVGEAGIDQGGIFRDALAAIASELMTSMSLFIKQPDGCVLNPVHNSFADHAMLRCLGRLMAVCVGSDDLLALDLHPNIWRQLTDEHVDVKESNVQFFKTLEWIEGIDASTYNAEAFDALCLSFSVDLPDGGVVDLLPDGRHKKVTLENKSLYVDLARAHKICEGAKQVASIKEGMLQVLPRAALTMMTASDLEERVCGQREIDVAMLMEHAHYGKQLKNSNVIDNFWMSVKSFTQADLQAFLRFVTGRPRLPLGKSAMLSIDSIDEPRDGLPEAHTCSSLICLPPYSSIETMRRQLLYAIRNCDTTDIA
eukprot:TRINITY_DN1866_c0_g1_i1.p1 TRINITY_DN1866_c0_g1~~TRINITY_DN1866_c0_g1_i1.p1  ORF type:complete len:2356 (+),score=593.02 TRINITY_DN1866_c0_g1_i1:203-7270(+)